MWYDLNNMISKNRLYSFVIGNRGGGKTFASQKFCINNYKKTGKKFIWLRRYESEIKDIKGRWCSNDLRAKFQDDEISFSGKKILLNGEECGILMALSTSMRVKSVAFDEFNLIVYDEFILDNGSLRYIKDEVILFNNFFESVDRLRDETRVIFIANAITIVNPYFTFFNVKPDLDKEFTLYQDIAIQLFKDEEYVQKKLTTRFGRLNKNNRYGKFAVDNAFLRDNTSFIKPRPKNLSYLMTIIYDDGRIGVWYDEKDDIYYIDDKIEINCKIVVALNNEDMTELSTYKKAVNVEPRLKILKMYYNESRLFFSDQLIKKNIYEIMTII